MTAINPTAAEHRAIDELHRLARRWPKSLWLLSASGTLCVMRAGPDGEHVRAIGSNGVDSAYVLATVKIPNDGGDW